MEKLFIDSEVIEEREGRYALRLTYPSGEVRLISTFSTRRALAEEVCDRINRNSVSAHHIDDILEDILG